jgi:lipooligosaccharide transport system ATP-binding protein
MKEGAGVQEERENVVEVRGLSKFFGDYAAVNDISFDIRRGECFGVLGPNGAGKTSTIRMIYGFSPMTSGQIDVFGLSIKDGWREIRSRIGVCQQENTLDPDLSVKENLVVFAGYFNIPRNRARQRTGELLKFIALSHRSDDEVSQLSGGLVRRLVLARALINEPELLILDEPTTGLDPQSRHQLWQRLEELKGRGLSILLTTHDMHEAAYLCDRLIIMDRGSILVEGRPRDLIQEYVGHEVLEMGNPGDDLRGYLKTQELIYEDLGHRLIVYGQKGNSIFEKVGRDYCRDMCTMRMATLEDVFLKLTGRELRE